MNSKCPNCGELLENNKPFCPFCGATLEKSEQTPPSPPISENNEPVNTETPAETVSVENNSAPVFEENITNEPPKKKKKKKKAPFIVLGIFLLLIILFLVIVFYDSDDPKSDVNVGKTVMIYMVGSDLESDEQFATDDLNEIMASGVDTEVNNILICTGGATEWHNDFIDEDETAILKLKNAAFEKIESYPAKNMGESKTLSDFITYGMTNYPNDQFVLLLWDHGGGPINGYGDDQIFDDELSMEELNTAFKDAKLGKDNKLEMIGFDACIMGNIETAWCLKDYANYLVSSQENEPGFGWDYEFLKNLQNYPNGLELGKVIVDEYVTSYDDYELTLSCMDLSKVANVEKCIDDFFGDINKYMSEDVFPEISKARYETKAFAKSTQTDLNTADIVDLKHLVTLIEKQSPTKAKALQNSLSELVCYSRSTVDGVSGVSIWHPYENPAYMMCIEEFIQTYQTLDFSENYTKYLVNFCLMKMGADAETAALFSNVIIEMKNQNDFSTQLSKEQLASLAGVEYVVYSKIDKANTFSGKDEYIPVFTGEDFEIGDDGTISASFSSKAVFAIDKATGEDHGMPIFLDYIRDGSGNFKYSTDAFFSRTTTTEDNLVKYDSVHVRWVLKSDGDTVYFSEALKLPEEGKEKDFTPGKQNVDPADYDTYTIANPSYFITTDANGNTVLKKTGSGYGIYLERDPGYELEYREIADLENYCVLFKLTDVYGNVTYTSPISLAE